MIASLSADFDPADLQSDYRRDLRALLEAKIAGEEITVPEPVEEAPVLDLMEALKRSVAEAKQAKKPAGSDKPAAGRKASRPRKTAAR